MSDTLAGEVFYCEFAPCGRMIPEERIYRQGGKRAKYCSSRCKHAAVAERKRKQRQNAKKAA